MTDKYAQDNSTHACAQQGGNCQANTQRLMVGEKLCFLMNTVVTLGAGPEILRTTGALHGVYEKREKTLYSLYVYIMSQIYNL